MKAIAEFIDCYVTLPFADMIQRASINVNIRRFTEFTDRYFYIPLPITTKHELGLPSPPRNLRIKFGANPSIIFFSYCGHRQTDRHTHTHTQKPTPVNTYSLAFMGIIIIIFTFLHRHKVVTSEAVAKQPST